MIQVMTNWYLDILNRQTNYKKAVPSLKYVFLILYYDWN